VQLSAKKDDSKMSSKRQKRRKPKRRPGRRPVNLKRQAQKISRLMKEERWAEALTALDAYRQHDPDSEFTLNNIGTCYDHLGEFERAADWFAQATERHPRNPKLVWGLALSQANAGRLEAAITSFQRFKQLDPQSARAFQVDRTIEGLRMILRGELGPHHYQIDTLMDRAFHYADMGEWKTALEWIERALALDPDDDQILYNQARILQEIDEQASIPVYERVAGLTEHDARPAYNVANIYWRRGELERAIAAYEQAIATDPTFVSSYHNLGVIYEEMGQVERAIELWRKVLEIDPTHQNARISLQHVGIAVETEADRREAQRDQRRATLAKRVRQFRRTAPQAQVYENDHVRLMISPQGVAFESLRDELDCAMMPGLVPFTWLSDEQAHDWLREIRARLREVHWTNTREMLVHLQYDERDSYTFFKRFEDGDEREALTEGKLDVGRIPAWGKLRSDSDLQLKIVSGTPLMRGLAFFLRLDDGRNLLILGLGEHRSVETYD
jgi:tetratricopeptide (TPR) repeat protein